MSDALTYKHLLLPLWLLAYRYSETTYQVMVNAQTGEVQGERPWELGQNQAGHGRRPGGSRWHWRRSLFHELVMGTFSPFPQPSKHGEHD